MSSTAAGELPLEVSVHELKRALDAGSAVLVDVREPWEAEIAKIEGATLVPLGEFAERAKSLDPGQSIYVLCHHGGRSLQATMWLRRNGFAKAVT
ncbi:MAG: rhodanese-like domain-containing protein, partial [Alphaproteobacteria bacterium]